MNYDKSKSNKGIMIAIIVILIIAVAVMGYVIYKDKQESIKVSENNYNRAFYEVVDYIQNVEVYLAKSMITSTTRARCRNTNTPMERSKPCTKLLKHVTNRKSRTRKYRKIFKPSK